MPTLSQIRTAIVNKMKTVPDIGKVHSYQRYEANATALAGLYRTSIGGVEQLRGWYVTRVGTVQSSPGTGRYVINHRWRIRGFMGLDDARTSELTFDDLIDAARLAFRDDETLGGVVAGTALDQTGNQASPAGLQLDEQVPVMFAGVLCHSAAMTLNTWHTE